MGTRLKKFFAQSLALLLALTCLQNESHAFGRKRIQLPNFNGPYQGSFTLESKPSMIVTLQPPAYRSNNAGTEISFRPSSVYKSSVLPEWVLQYDRKNRPRSLLLKTNVVQQFEFSNTDENCSYFYDESKNEAKMCDGASDFAEVAFTFTATDPSFGRAEFNLKRADGVLPSDGNLTVYTLDELLARAKWNSYTSTQTAERVFQSKKNVSVSRGNLLPGISLRSVLGVFTGDVLSVVGAVVPFLFPSNWYQLRISQALYSAEKSSYASLRGNLMNTVEGLYYTVLRDQKVSEALKGQIQWLKNTQANLQKEEEIGTLPRGTADYYGTFIAQLSSDSVSLNSLIQNNYSELAQSVALPPRGALTGIQAVQVPDLSVLPEIDTSLFTGNVIQRSYELKTLTALKTASQNMSNEVIFGFLSPEFGTNLGFGTAARVAISRSKIREIEIRADETTSILTRNLVEIGNRYNAALTSYKISKDSSLAVLKRIRWLITQHLNGNINGSEFQFVESLLELQKQYIGLVADLATTELSFQVAQSQLNRMLLEGAYSKLDEGLL